MKQLYLLSALCALAACQQNDSEPDRQSAAEKENVAGKTDDSDFNDVAGEAPPLPAALQPMQAQVALERLGYSPGVIDGKGGETLKIALSGFQAANKLEETGVLDAKTKAALFSTPPVYPTRLVRIPAAFANQRFFPDLPEDAAEQAQLPALGYRNLMEALAERFHTTPETLIALNSPETAVGADKIIVVPNIAEVMSPRAGDMARGWDKTLLALSVAPKQPPVERIVVDESGGWLRAYGADDRVISQFPVTTGSAHDPLPIGKWTIKGVARNPDFHYNPKLFWDASEGDERQILKPGPNGPVGVVWIDLSKPRYGIHGTQEPSTIGRAESHGCVRLTNWDAAKLAGMVSPGVKVVFQK